MAQRRPRVATAGAGAPWIARLSGREWAVLGVTMLFWLFDGYETFAVIITGFASLHELLPASAASEVPRYFGYLIAITLAGWAVGGVAGGFVGDRLGRRKTMIGAVVLYGVFTGLSALSPTWTVLAATRFLTGIGIGAEWGVGTSLLQEVWPAEARTKGAGLLQSTFSVGGLVASGLWILFSAELGISWRFMYVVGILPAFLVIFLRKAIPESQRWVGRRHGSLKALVAELMAPALRRSLGWGLVVSVAITLGWWASSSYLPSYVGGLASPARVGFYTGLAAALYNLGEIAGCIVFGFSAEAIGRRSTAVLYFAGSLVTITVVFLLVRNVLAAVLLQLVSGYVAGGLYSWYAVHPPELFPTAVRASAISVIFNITRVLALAGALLTGTLAGLLGGVGNSAAIFASVYILGIVGVLLLPETKGRPLPS